MINLGKTELMEIKKKQGPTLNGMTISNSVFQQNIWEFLHRTADIFLAF